MPVIDVRLAALAYIGNVCAVDYIGHVVAIDVENVVTILLTVVVP